MKKAFQIIFITFFFFIYLNSCTDVGRNPFPYTEKELIEYNLVGELLEYAVYDSSKIEFVENLLCDRVEKNQELVFFKYEKLLLNDSSYYFFVCDKRQYVINDYIGMIYFDTNDPDSLFYYSETFKYSIKDFDNVINEIVEHNKSTIEETVKHRRIGNFFIPHFYFIVELHTMDCNDGFVRKATDWHNKVDRLMDSYSERHFKNEQIKIRPYIEIRVTFANK